MCTTADAAYAAVATSAANRSRPAGWPLHSSAFSVSEHLLQAVPRAACCVRMSSLFLFEFVKRYVRKEEKGKRCTPAKKKNEPVPSLSLLLRSFQAVAVFFRHKKCSPMAHVYINDNRQQSIRKALLYSYSQLLQAVLAALCTRDAFPRKTSGRPPPTGLSIDPFPSREHSLLQT